MRRVLLTSLALLSCCSRTRPSAVATPRVPAAPVVVALVIDQQSAWAAAERWPTLPPSGGFARLRREGTWMQNVRFAHAACDTAPGHAAIHTGFPPSQTGIVANERVEDGRAVPMLRDPATVLVDDTGETTLPGSSIARVRVDTLADRLRAKQPEATIVSLSIKDRAAIFGGGRAPDAVLWFEPKLDRFVTSTAFAAAFPAWARARGGSGAVAALRSAPWALLDSAFVQQHAASPDDAPGEGDLDGLGTTFPHVVTMASGFRASPFADEAVLALAKDALAARAPRAPMLLSVSLSANDYVAHVFGPDSFEAWDELLRLDRSLGAFFSALDGAVGPEGWSLVLTGDHGSAPLPELEKRPFCAPGSKDPWDRPCAPGVRIDPTALRDRLQAGAEALLGPGRWIDGAPDPWVVYTPAARALAPDRRAALDARMLSTLATTAGVHAAFSVRALAADCAGPKAADALLASVCASTDASAPYDLYVVTRPGSFFDSGYVPGKGMNHGSPWPFDRTVPLLVRAPGRVPAAVVRDEVVSYGTTTRALAALLHLPPDPRWPGVDLVR
jgi:hypothetical protein